MKPKNKIGVISCEDAPKWGGEEGLCNYIIERLQNVDSNTEYVPFHAVTGRLPRKSDLEEFTGFVISGSHYSVNDSYQWIKNLIEFVRYFGDEKGAKLFGICFGQQLIAKAFGGKVQRNESGKFVWGTEEVEIYASRMPADLHERSFGLERRSVKIMQSHGEWVSAVPKGTICLGKSQTCSYEILSYGSRIMSTQGHPELLKDAMIGKILPRLQEKSMLNSKEEENARATLTDEDHTMLMQFVHNFLTS